MDIWGLIGILATPFEAAAGVLRATPKAVAARLRATQAPDNDALAHLPAIIELSDDALIGTSPSGVITAWNDGAERLYGYCAAEIIDRSIALLIPADRQEEMAHLLDRLGRGERIERFETVRVRKDGTPVDVSLTIVPATNQSGAVIGAWSIAHDLGARRQAEVFRAMLEAAPDAMVIVDAQGMIVLVNAQTEALFGYPREELIGQTVERLVPEHLRAQHIEHRTDYQHQPKVRPMGAGLVLHGRRKDGREFPIEISLSPLQTDHGRLVTAAVRDITDRTRAEEEEEDAAACQTELPPAAQTRRPLRILLAEDNLIDQRLVSGLLEPRGHSVVAAPNGRAAVAAFVHERFDAVLMDVQMPEMDGFEATAAIRAHENGATHVPIIAVTAHAMLGDRERCQAAGMDAALTKPIRPRDLFDTLDRMVTEHHAAHRPSMPIAPSPPDAPSPPLDIEGLLARAHGNTELVRRLVHVFVDEYPIMLADIRTALARSDQPALQVAVHALKGAVQDLGGIAAGDAAEHLEQVVRSADLQDAEDACAALETQIERLKPALTALL